MSQAPSPQAVNIRPAVPQDAEGITRTYMESAEYHAQLEAERYYIPPKEKILARYREGRQHPPDAEQATTLVAELGREIVGFVDVRLSQSPDPMHRDFVYCYIVEIAVSRRHQDRGIGARLLQSAEEWGRQHGATYAMLEHLAANTHAARFYQQRGYKAASILEVKRF